MERNLPICATCGVQYGAPRADCPICLDERQYVGWDGQRWTTLAELRTEGCGRIAEEGPGVTGVGADPPTAIGQRALLVAAPGGNVLWDMITFIDDELVDQVRQLGGVSAIAISHPHFYGSMIEWAHAFDAPVYIHEDDRRWIARPDDSVVFWAGSTRPIGDGLTLVNLGVHFDGGQVLYRANGPHGAGALFSGDIVGVMLDRRWVSFMYSFPNYIPERPARSAGHSSCSHRFTSTPSTAAGGGESCTARAPTPCADRLTGISASPSMTADQILLFPVYLCHRKQLQHHLSRLPDDSPAFFVMPVNRRVRAGVMNTQIRITGSTTRHNWPAQAARPARTSRRPAPARRLADEQLIMANAFSGRGENIMLSWSCGPGSRDQVGQADGVIPGKSGPRPPGPAACPAGAAAVGKTRLQLAALGGVLALAAVLSAGCVSISFTPGGTPHVAAAGASQPCRGVSFRHPPGWQEGSFGGRVVGTGRLCQTGLFVGPSDGIAISAWLLPRPVTARNLAMATPIFAGQIRRLVTRGGGALEAGPRRIRVGGLPALWFRASGLSPSGARVDTALVFAFDGRIQYELICQHTPPHAAQVADACRQVLRTFTVTSPVKPASAPPGSVAAPPTSTQRWLTGLAAVQALMTNAGPPNGVPATPSSLRLTAAKLRRCTAQLTALGRPPRALRAVYRQARQACADFERGAKCYTAAAPVLNSAQAGKLLNSCAADTNHGSDLIGLAVAEGSSLSQQN